jgi:hypothetical protein
LLTEAARGGGRAPAAAVVAAVVAAALAATVGVVAYLVSPTNRRGAPVQALSQLGLLYLDEPAPMFDELGFTRGAPALLVVCSACTPPAGVGGQVRVTDDPEVAAAYALAVADGRIGPGYAVIDPAGRVRYRTFDPALSEHGREIRVLLDAVR